MLTLVLSVVDSTVLVGDEFLGSLHSEVDCVGNDFLLLNLTYLYVSITPQVTRLLAYARVDSFNLNKGLNLMHKFVAKTEK